MSSTKDLSPPTNSNEVMNVDNIIATLSTLLVHLSEVKRSVPQCSSSNNPTSSNMYNEFEKLQRDLNQIKESFQKLKKFEDDADGPSLNEISHVVAQASNDLLTVKQVDAMSSSKDLCPPTNSNEVLNIDNIIAALFTLLIQVALSTLLVHLSEVKHSVPQCSSSNNPTSSNMYNEFEKLQRDLNQIKESFQKFKKFEDDADGLIKNLECSLNDISHVVAQASNDLLTVKQVDAMSSPKDLCPPTNSNEVLNIDNIIAALSTLLVHLSEVKHSAPQCSSGNNPTSSNMYNEFEKLRRDLNQIKESFQKLKKFEDDAGEPIKNLECSLKAISHVVAQAPNDLFPVKQVEAKLSALRKDAMKLRLNFPSLAPKMSTKDSNHSSVRRFSWSTNGSNIVVNELSFLHMNHKFISCPVFTEFQEVFENLDIRLKLCLLSFVVLPEDVVVKRRLLINWWVGECLVDPPTTGEKTAEDIADEILKEFEVKGFIEPVKERHKLVADRYKMQPMVHCVVIVLAQEAGFFDYHFKGIPTINSSKCNRACLVKDEDGTLEKVLENRANLDPEKLQTIFNVNEPLPDLRFKDIVGLFSRMKNVNVLSLGRWQSSGEHHNQGQSSVEHHIEVQSTEFLKGLKNMKHLRLLSLQGISRINELPDSLGKLTNLCILDLKACHNLEVLPDAIASLKKLLRLDISECYLLDGMPKGLASLRELQVLKGFVIGNLKSKSSCTLDDLIGLKKLSKLSINTSSSAFPTEKELHTLRRLEALQKLAIAWSENCKKQENDVLNSMSPIHSDNRRQDSRAAKPKRILSQHSSKLMREPEMPTKLEKLELQCFPNTGTPGWLIPRKLQSLKKLYIRGGKLNNLRQMPGENVQWTVEILRLKYLHEFNMTWDELLASFPNLIFSEKVQCPNLKPSPHDVFGVWLKIEQSPPLNIVVNELSILHMNHKSISCPVFTEFQEVFENLDIRLKLCLLSFVVLPEDVVVKRRLLINWWVGECLVDPPTTGEKTAEDIADEILKEFEVKGFIEPVKERHKLVADRYKMQPMVHCVVIVLAQEAGFFDYHFKGIPTINSSKCNRACLVKDEDGTLENVLENRANLDPEKLQTIFNVNEPLPDLRFKNIVGLFSRMKNVNVLSFGRWQSSGEHHNQGQSSVEHHIEVQSTEFLKGLKNMKHLRLLSLQGISRINELPDSLGKLTNLCILDLKACHNLEVLPDAIASLNKLLRLDISECYLLDGMPKGLASLRELQVLKGFVIGNLKSKSSCTLDDLIGLKKLSKLSINSSSKAFPTEKELHTLRRLEALQKLAIAWSENSKKQENDLLNSMSTIHSDNRRQDSGAAKPKRILSQHSSKLMREPEMPTKLEKLELQCFPNTGTPGWLIPRKLQSLKKLYIRGGKLNNLRQMPGENDKWTVEILRLKYLDKFNMDWSELLTSFPNLIFSENVDCPNLKSSPHGKSGVWLKTEQCQ